MMLATSSAAVSKHVYDIFRGLIVQITAENGQILIMALNTNSLAHVTYRALAHSFYQTKVQLLRPI
jgi:hypothetical protein